MNFLSYLITSSLDLDNKFIKKAHLSGVNKIEFIIKKYQLIIKHFILKKKFILAKDKITLFKRDLYYDCLYGIGGYQRILSSHQNIFDTAHIEQAKTIIDVGANVGYFTLFCRHIFPQSTLYSFEPGPEAFEALELNCKSDKNIHLYNAAVSNKSGKTKITVDSEISALSRVSEDEGIDISAVSLDDFIEQQKITSIDLLKIDAEGHEKHILEGGHQALKITTYLFIELTLVDNENYTFSSVLHPLATPDYEFQLLSFRNMANKTEGEIPIVELLLVNTNKSKNLTQCV